MLLILFAAALLRLGGILGKELWLDELHSFIVCRQPVKTLLTPGALSGYTPLYFILAKPFSLSPSDWVTRIPSVIFGVSTIALLGRFWPRRSGGETGSLLGFTILFPLMAALSPALVVFSSYHRMYSLYAFLVALSLFAWQRPGGANALLYVFASAAGFLVFPNGVFYVAAVVVVSLLTGHHRPRAFVAGLCALGLALLFSYKGLDSISTEAHGAPTAASRFPAITVHLVLAHVKFLMAGPVGFAHPVLRMLGVPLFALGLAALARGFVKGLRGDRTALLFTLVVVLAPACEYLLLPLGVTIFQFKSYLPSAVPLLALVADMLSSARTRFARAMAGVVVTFLAVVFLATDVTWIDPAQPFSMSTSRGPQFAPLHERAAGRIEGVDSGSALTPLVLHDLAAVISALRYAPPSERPRVAIREELLGVSIPGAYQSMIFREVKAAGIRILRREELTPPMLWIGAPLFDPARTLMISPAGHRLDYVPDSAVRVGP